MTQRSAADGRIQVTRADIERRQRFDALFATYKLEVSAYCSWRLGSAADAEDAVAEVFLVAWRRLDDAPPDDAAKVWLYAVARRVIANQRRAQRRVDALRQRVAREPAAAMPHTAGGSREEALVHEALARLSDRDREVLLLAEWANLTAAEIASVFGCPTVTARGRLHRARQRFRRAFETLARSAESHVAASQPLVRKAHA
jgi:RNA polymerase sigma-70 factor (ECF subfamily)